MSDDNGAQWHMDKRVPVAMLIGLAIQAGAAIWWAAGITGQVAGNSDAIAQLAARSELQRSNIQAQAVLLGRIEEQITGLRADLGRLVVVLERRSDLQ